MKRLTKTDQNVWNFYIRNLPSKKTINLETQKLNFKKDYKLKKLKSGDNFYIDKKDFKNLKNNSLKVDAILDLHGFNKIEAYSKLTNFVKNCYTNNLKNVVVITGKPEANASKIMMGNPSDKDGKTNTSAEAKSSLFSSPYCGGSIVTFSSIPNEDI